MVVCIFTVACCTGCEGAVAVGERGALVGDGSERFARPQCVRKTLLIRDF